jgi:hypothetical protein
MAKPNYKPFVPVLQRERVIALFARHPFTVALPCGQVCAANAFGQRSEDHLDHAKRTSLHMATLCGRQDMSLLSCRAMGMCHGTDRNRKISDSLRPTAQREQFCNADCGRSFGDARWSCAVDSTVHKNGAFANQAISVGHLAAHGTKRNCRCRSPLDCPRWHLRCIIVRPGERMRWHAL